MSRSRKKAIYKDKKLKEYHKIVRRVTKQAIKQGEEIPNPKVIINDYDYSDYTFDYEYKDKDSKWAEKISRK